MAKIIGIDLGTTNSCVAVLEGKDPVVIPNNEGRNTTPSVVAFVDGGERKVGDPAKRQAITNPTRTIYSIKRFMGETCDKVEDEIKRVPYKVVCQNNMPKVDIDGRDYTPQEISAMILQKMKKTAEDYLGQEVTEAVITVLGLLRRFSASGHQGSLVRLPVLKCAVSSTSLLPLRLHTVLTNLTRNRKSQYSTSVAVLSISLSLSSATVCLK